MSSVYRKIYITLTLIVLLVTAAWVFAYTWKVEHTSELATVENPSTKTNSSVVEKKNENNEATSTLTEQPAVATTTIATTTEVSLNDKIKLTKLKSGDLVESPLIIDGEARGSWYFEGVFPIELRDGSGKLISSGQAEALGDWMTGEFVAFNAKLTFLLPQTATGTVIFKKDNPSGLLENDESINVVVRFK